MATQRTYMNPITGTVVHFNANRTYMSPFGTVVSEQLIAAPPTGGDLLLTNRSIANYQGIRQ